MPREGPWQPRQHLSLWKNICAAPSSPTPSTSRARSRSAPSGENDHSAWQRAILFWFQQQAKTGQIRVRPELRVQVAPTCFLVPDVTLLDRNRPIEQIVTHPPVAVFEILSPADALKRVMAKCGRYEHMGIRTILVIDPDGPSTGTWTGGLSLWIRAPSTFPAAWRASIWMRSKNCWTESGLRRIAREIAKILNPDSRAPALQQPATAGQAAREKPGEERGAQSQRHPAGRRRALPAPAPSRAWRMSSTSSAPDRSSAFNRLPLCARQAAPRSTSAMWWMCAMGYAVEETTALATERGACRPPDGFSKTADLPLSISWPTNT